MSSEDTTADVTHTKYRSEPMEYEDHPFVLQLLSVLYPTILSYDIEFLLVEFAVICAPPPLVLYVPSMIISVAIAICARYRATSHFRICTGTIVHVQLWQSCTISALLLNHLKNSIKEEQDKRESVGEESNDNTNIIDRKERQNRDEETSSKFYRQEHIIIIIRAIINISTK